VSGGSVTCTPCDSNGTWLITLHGEHDLATRPVLERETRAVWPLCKVAIIDLSDTTFIDSGVVRWLLSAEAALEAAGGHSVRIVEGPPGSVAHRLFALLRIRHVVPCYPTQAEALAQVPATTLALVTRGWTVSMRPREEQSRRHAA
jgi:anti-anti-sigma regulatory factor